MRDRRKRVILLALIAGMLLAAPRAGSERVPAEAVAAAKKYLQQAIARGERERTYFERSWDADGITDCAALSLGEPYERYLFTDQAIFDFADSTGWEFGRGARFLGYFFPVLYGSEYIGTIGINNVDGVWDCRGRNLKTANYIDPFILRLQAEFPATKGYRVSALYTFSFGFYVLLFENEKLVKLSQMMPDPHNRFGFPANSDGTGSPISIDAVNEPLRAAAIKYKERSQNSKRGREELQND